MDAGLPVTSLAFSNRAPPGREALGVRTMHVQSIYDYKVYRAPDGKFHAIETRTGSHMGPFTSQSVAVKAVIQTYVAHNVPRGANPSTKPYDSSRPLGFFTNRGTSI